MKRLWLVIIMIGLLMQVIESQCLTPITYIDSIAAVTCYGDSNGKISVYPSGGSIGNYFYLWSNNDTAAFISNLISGIYTVVISDGASCRDTSAIIISQPASPVQVMLPPLQSICSGDTM